MPNERTDAAQPETDTLSTALPPHPGPAASREAVLGWIREKVGRFNKTPGVYLMKDSADRVLYIGKARSLRDRVMSYFQKSANLRTSRGPRIATMVADEVVDVDALECDGEVDAMLTENRLIKDIQPPYNERLRDDKSFPYLMVTTGEDFPGVYVTREPRDGRGVRLFGPFTSAAGLRDAVNNLQKVFKFRTCHLEISADDSKRRFFRPCLLHAINQCTAPCADLIDLDTYRQDVTDLIALLNSKRSIVLRNLTQQMNDAATKLEYEEAARLRDRIKALQALSLSGSPRDDEQPEVFYQDPRKGLDKLAELLSMDEAPRSVEGIDIAHLQGEETVGALVCFIDGLPFKAGYKRFKIRTVTGVDDYASISEVIARRYRHAAVNQELYPDVILIDGGLGQLHAAVQTFEKMRSQLAEENVDMIPPPKLVAIAKGPNRRQDLLHTLDREEPLDLPRNHDGLRLLQSVRDEAHRFSQHYHHLLRAKRSFDEDVNQGKRPPRRGKGKVRR